MIEKIAKVESTFLGVEDHGILTCMLHVAYGASGKARTVQGIGGYAFDEPDKSKGEWGRRGNAFGMEWVRRAIAACGVDSWEKIKGRTIFVYFENDDWGGKPLGIGPLPTEPGEKFMFKEIGDEYFPKEKP